MMDVSVLSVYVCLCCLCVCVVCVYVCLCVCISGCVYLSLVTVVKLEGK